MPSPTLFDIALRKALEPTARGITRTGPCKATGNDRVAQNDEAEPLFTESELLAADRNRNADKAAALLASSVDRAHADEVHRLRCLGGL